MTKEEAINQLKVYEEFASNGLKEAFKVAIKSMEKLSRIEKLMEESNE